MEKTQAEAYVMRRELGTAAKILLMVVFGLPVTLLQGCKDDQPQVEILSIEGTIESVNARSDGTGSVKVSFFNPKRQEETVGTGLITKETAIQINGVVATIQDLRVGDHVRSDVRIEKVAGDRRLMAMKVVVNRTETSSD